MKKDKQLGQGLGALLTPSKSKLEDYNQSSILISKIKPIQISLERILRINL